MQDGWGLSNREVMGSTAATGGGRKGVSVGVVVSRRRERLIEDPCVAVTHLRGRLGGREQRPERRQHLPRRNNGTHSSRCLSRSLCGAAAEW